MGGRAYHDCRFGTPGCEFAYLLGLVCAFCMEVEERWGKEAGGVGRTDGDDDEGFYAW